MEPVKIWIVNASGHNFEQAKYFGDELIPLTVGKVNIFNVNRLVDEIKGMLGGMGEEDWVLLSGNSMLNVIVALIVFSKFDRLKVLIYDVIRKEYVPREIESQEIKT